MIIVEFKPVFEIWKEKALQILSADIHHEEVIWNDGNQTGFLLGDLWTEREKKEFHVPKSFANEAQLVAAHRDPSTWNLLYRLLWRLTHQEKNLFADPLDPDVMEFQSRLKSVTRDMHKMKAFVRFKKVQLEEGEWFTAWHGPDHRIIRLIAPFFKDRFQGMNWTIMTEDGSAHWNGSELTFSEGVAKTELPKDEQDDLWKAYYSSIFNPARIKIKAMKKELPVRYWKSMPETELIDELIAAAPDRLEEFYLTQKPLPAAHANIISMADLSAAIKTCKSCGICEQVTAPVMGDGPLNARIMLVGEQPGDEEDLSGKPFVGPAGKLLDQALNEVAIKRGEIYVTNAVKGFKWLPKERRRWHRTANGSEISACRPWLKTELDLVKPDILVCLGRSAAQSILGKIIKLEDVRGTFFKTAYCENTIILPHPSSILRTLDQEEKKQAYLRFVSELKLIALKCA